MIKTVGVVGSGTMGSGIAQICAMAGFNVVLVDITEPALKNGIDHINQSLDRLVAKEKLDGSSSIAARARIKPTTNYDDLSSTQFVVEAATENYDLKIKILAKIEDVVDDSTILATNTSSISITSLSGSLKRPSNFIGMHFFNPVPVMPLVEIIRGIETSEATERVVQGLTSALQKKSVSVRNSPGFVVNRILVPMINEAFFLLMEGVATAEDIDAGMRAGANQPIGPLALGDLVGLDVCLSVMDVFHKDFGDSKYRACPLLRELVAAGRLGRKTGRGVFTY
jgi:3-hydroxybutyryl-CoA dehydrogenase